MSLANNIANISFDSNRPKISVGFIIRKITSYLHSELTRTIKE